MEKRIMHIYFGNDLLPYKDKECQVHFPVAGNTFAGGSLATEIRFYVDNIGGYENITWLVNSKRPDGSLAYQKLTVSEEEGEKFLSLVLSSYYTQYVGDLYLTLNGYDGGLEIELDDTDQENPIWTINGTPIVQATGSIKLSIAYAVQMPSDYGEVPMISVQDALAIVNQKADKTYVDNQDQAIYSYVDEEVARLETDINGKVDKLETSGTRVYSHTDATQGEIIVSQSALPNFIPRYDNEARLKVNVPQLPFHAANKGYVDGKETALTNLINKAGHTLSLIQNTQTYDYVIQLKDKSGSVISSIDIDLPLEQIITSGYYDEEEKAIVLVLDNGSEVSIPIGDLVEGLIDQETLTQELHDYVKDVEITSIKTVSEVLTEIGGLNHIFSFDLMGIKYLGLFVEGTNDTTDLELWTESGTSKVVNIDTTQLFRDEIANAVSDKIYLPIVSLSNPITTLSDSEMGVLAQDNSVISYGGRVYVKANDTETSMEFVCADIDDVSENGSHTQSKYEITINKSTKGTNVITISNYYYDKSQTDTLLGGKANKVGELPTVTFLPDDVVYSYIVQHNLSGKVAIFIDTYNERTYIGKVDVNTSRQNCYIEFLTISGDKLYKGPVDNLLEFQEVLTTGGRLYTYPTTADVSSAISSAIATLKENSYQIVDLTEYPTEQDFLQSVGEAGYIYLYPLDTTDLTKGYHQYIWENNAWLDIGKTSVDLTQYPTKTEVATDFSNIVANEYDNTQTYVVCDLCLHNMQLYKCITAITTAEDFDSNKWVAVKINGELKNCVDLTSAQTISGIKTFDTALGGNVKITMNGVEKFAIYPDGNTYNTKMNVQGATKIRFDATQINFYNNVVPLTNGNLDLGVSSFKWRDLYLSRNLTDGTNSVTVAHLAQNTPTQWYGTQAQYDALGTYDSNTIYNILES